MMHPTLTRLDALAEELAARPGTVAVLGLGSAGVEFERFDDHSDIDFFVIVDGPSGKAALLDELSWLAGLGGAVEYSFVNDPNGRKALFEDGLFVEYAVFTVAEFHALPVVGVRTVWCRDHTLLRLGELPAPPEPALDSIEFHVNEALTNLYVGLRRELRGERLTAFRFIQVYAVNQVLALLRLDPETAWPNLDRFEPTRRAERIEGVPSVPFADLAPGYRSNRAAARATLEWLASRYSVDRAIAAAVQNLLQAETAPSATGVAK